MAKLLFKIIKSCKECPYCRVINECVYICAAETPFGLLGVDYKGQLYYDKIPKWCPLEDHQDEVEHETI
jgi:hypothetical protein